MSKVKYFINNGDHCPIIIWETKFGLVMHDRGLIDLQNGLEIIDAETYKVVKNIDLMEFLFKSLQFENDTDELVNKILDQNK